MLAGCGPLPPSPEHQLLTDFFEASRLRDRTVLARMASVVFEPRRDGVVQEFKVVDDGADAPSKVVTVNARVRTPDGQTVERTFAFTIDGRFITGFQQLPASRTSP